MPAWIANSSAQPITCPECRASVQPAVEHRHVAERVVESSCELSDSALPLLPVSTLRDHLAAMIGRGTSSRLYLQRVAAAVVDSELARGRSTSVETVLDNAEQQALAVLDARSS